MDSVYDDDDVDDEFLVSPAHVDAVLNFMEQTDTTSKTPSVGRGQCRSMNYGVITLAVSGTLDRDRDWNQNNGGQYV